MDKNKEEKDNKKKQFDWATIVISALAGAMLSAFGSILATYYTHGLEIARISERLKIAEERTKQIADRLNVIQTVVPTPVPTVSPSKAKPEVKIKNFASGDVVEVRPSGNEGNKAHFYTVSGTSSNVALNNTLSLYILVRPHGGNNWYFQTDDQNINPETGEWNAKAWIGSEKIAPKDGDKFDVATVVAEPAFASGKQSVTDLKELKPEAFSVITQLQVKLTK